MTLCKIKTHACAKISVMKLTHMKLLAKTWCVLTFVDYYLLGMGLASKSALVAKYCFMSVKDGRKICFGLRII